MFCWCEWGISSSFARGSYAFPVLYIFPSLEREQLTTQAKNSDSLMAHAHAGFENKN